MRNPIKVLGDFAARLAGARTALDDLHTLDKDLRQEHERLTTERARIASSLPPKPELISRIHADVDSFGAEWRRYHVADILAIGRPSDHAVAAHSQLVLGVGQVDIAALAGCIPEVLKAGLAAVVNEAVFEAGPLTADRPRLLEALDRQIADVEQQHSELVDQGATLGIKLELLEPVRSRRAMDARRREIEEREARDRARKVR